MPSKVKNVTEAPNMIEQKTESVPMATYMIVAIVGTILIAVMSAYAGYNIFKQAQLNQKVISAKGKADKALQQKVEDAPKLIQDYKDLGDRKKLIEHGLPTSADFPQIVSIASAVATTSGATLMSVSPSSSDAATAAAAATTASGAPAPTSVAPAGPSTTSYSVTVKGNYSQLITVFKGLETSVRPMRVTSIELAGTSAQLNATITVTTYYQGKATVEDTTEVVK